MSLVTYDALQVFVDASVQGMEGNTILAGDEAGGEGRRGSLVRCHGKDRDGC